MGGEALQPAAGGEANEDGSGEEHARYDHDDQRGVGVAGIVDDRGRGRVDGGDQCRSHDDATR